MIFTFFTYMRSTLRYLGKSRKGLLRNKNQDKIIIFDEADFYLFVVFDGVSSLSSSYVFINHFAKALRKNIVHLKASGDNLSQILYATHQQVLSKQHDGMSTLSTLFYSKENSSAKYVNIGDSRIYQFNNQFIEKITFDDSLSDRSNILTKCLGTNDLTLADFGYHETDVNYNYLICTDGFYQLMCENLKAYFEVYNFKYLKNIEKKLSLLQEKRNYDDSSYILIKK